MRLEELSDSSCNSVLDEIISVRDTADGEFAVDNDIDTAAWADVGRSLELGDGSMLEELGTLRLEELSDLFCNPAFDVAVSVRDIVDGDFSDEDGRDTVTWVDVGRSLELGDVGILEGLGIVRLEELRLLSTNCWPLFELEEL